VAEFNASLAIASSHAPQIGTLSDSPATTPTATQGAFIHARAYDYIRVCLKRAGVSATFTASSAGLGWAQECEALLTSGRLLEAKGSVGRGAMGSKAGGSGDTTAERLIGAAMAMLDSLKTDRGLREALIADGSADNRPVSGFASSDWEDGRDPNLDTTYGGDDLLYVPGTAEIQDGESL